MHCASLSRFLSTPSGWRATERVCRKGRLGLYFYPRPPGGGRLYRSTKSFKIIYISIHALRVEGDRLYDPAPRWHRYFYPRPPGGGRRPSSQTGWTWRDFYPRPPGGGRLLTDFVPRSVLPISIHALRVEGDVSGVRGSRAARISIHALRVEGDGIVGLLLGQQLHTFLSTPSGWRATTVFRQMVQKMTFLSTPSGWRATKYAPV